MTNATDTTHVTPATHAIDTQLNLDERTFQMPLSRQAWIHACQFQPHSDEDVLREVARRVSQHKTPWVLLDLDSTLYEVTPRTHRILLEWAASTESDAFKDYKLALTTLEIHQVGYSIQDTLQNLKLISATETTKTEMGEKAFSSIRKFWYQRFFTNHYLTYDHPYAGAANFAMELYRLGAEVVYLTGRDAPGMGDGTRANLLRDEFPWGVPRTHLLMKPTYQMEDIEHKKQAAAYLLKNDPLVASFENEPPNVVALQRAFPEAMHVFVDTIYSDLPAMPGKDLFRIKGYPAIRP